MRNLTTEEAKAKMLTDYKDVIVNNFESVSYALYNILSSDKALEDCEAYENILKLSEKSSIKTNYDEKHILYLLSSMIHRLPYTYQEKEEKSAKIKCYSKYFEKVGRAS